MRTNTLDRNISNPIADEGSHRHCQGFDLVPNSYLPLPAIPMGVGKSNPPDRSDLADSGHAHAGGEIPRTFTPTTMDGGPSPRGWGNLNLTPCPSDCLRAIPTRVGKSGVASGITTPISGHPHAGGEIRPCCCIASCFVGPSPRGWGNHLQPLPRRAELRAIPTRVGKSLRLPVSYDDG